MLLPGEDQIGPGVYQLLLTFSRALEANEAVNASLVKGTLHVLLRGGVPVDNDCKILAGVVASVCNISGNTE